MGRDLVFVHVPKTGGISILPFCYHHNIKVIDHNTRDINHISLASHKAMNTDCFTFAFVRNPWDRVVSSFFYLKKGGTNEDDKKDAMLYLPHKDFDTFVNKAFQTKTIFEQMHFRPQYTWLSDSSGLIIDAVGKFEKLQTEFNSIFRSAGLPIYELPHTNKTQHAHYRDYYNPVTWEIVHKAYEKDIELFGYEADF